MILSRHSGLMINHNPKQYFESKASHTAKPPHTSVSVAVVTTRAVCLVSCRANALEAHATQFTLGFPRAGDVLRLTKVFAAKTLALAITRLPGGPSIAIFTSSASHLERRGTFARKVVADPSSVALRQGRACHVRTQANARCTDALAVAGVVECLNVIVFARRPF